MNLADLEQEIAVELEALQKTVDELLALQHDEERFPITWNP